MNRRRSFTLVEMMIALALVVALVFVLLPATNRIMSSTLDASDRGHAVAQVAVMWDVVDRSLLTAVAQGVDGAPGVTGESGVLRITSCGVSLTQRDASTPDDVQTLEIAFADGVLTLRTGNAERQMLLTDIEACRFEFNTAEGWTDAHDGQSGLPRAVAISIWKRQSELDEETDEWLADDEFGIEFESSERAPDWRRVFAVFDPGTEAETGSGAL